MLRGAVGIERLGALGNQGRTRLLSERPTQCGSAVPDVVISSGYQGTFAGRQAESRLAGAICHIVSSVFSPVLAKHSKSFNLIDTLSVGVDRIQRNFEPLQRQIEQWRQTQLTDDRAKLILYQAFVEGELEAPRSLLPSVHRMYFEPQYPEFSARTMWSLSNAFTSSFKELDPVPQFKATAKLGAFLEKLRQ